LGKVDKYGAVGIPLRCVAFCPDRMFFVSGGEDMKPRCGKKDAAFVNAMKDGQMEA